MAAKGVISYWWLPILSGLVWIGMLLGLFLHWIIDKHSIKYPSMEANQTIAYISDIGAQELKPLFVTGCVITTVLFDLSFAAERWLRHKGRLVPNMSTGEKALFGLSIAWAFVGTAGLILLSIFDTVHYPKLHDIFLLLFIGGYMLSAVFICWEAQRLGIKNRDYRVLRVSFWIKLTFILVELGLAIAFGVLTFKKIKNAAAVLEWTISVIYTFYVLSFAVDLWPAIKTKDPEDRYPKQTSAMMEEGSSDQSLYGAQQHGHNGYNY